MKLLILATLASASSAALRAPKHAALALRGGAQLGNLDEKTVLLVQAAGCGMFGTEFIKIAWTDDMSREMKLRGFLRTLSRCLTVAAETTRQHVMMACFPSPNSSAWNGSGASTFTPSTRRVLGGVAMPVGRQHHRREMT